MPQKECTLCHDLTVLRWSRDEREACDIRRLLAPIRCHRA